MAGKKKASLNIAFVLDMTGSMLEVKKQAIDGYNEYVTGMRDDEPGAEIALTTFNSSEIKVYPATTIKDAMLLNDKNYSPKANTPLYDAIGTTIAATEKRTKKGDKVAFVILTDGLENASREYTKSGIFAKLKEKERDGWGIVYLGANHDAYQEAMGLGIARSNSAAYTAKNTGSALAYAARSTSRLYARTGQTSDLMSEVDKDALMGDPFKPEEKLKKKAKKK